MPSVSVNATGVEAYLDSPDFEAALANDDGLAAIEHLVSCAGDLLRR